MVDLFSAAESLRNEAGGSKSCAGSGKENQMDDMWPNHPLNPWRPLPQEELPPPPAGIQDAEKAKLEYQFALETRKMERDHRYKLRQLAVDKGAFVLVGIVLLFAFNSCQDRWRQQEADRLETYKLDEARQRFFMDKRLDNLLSVTSAMSRVTAVYFEYTKEKLGASEDKAREEYSQALQAAREVINKAEILFDDDFNTDLDRYYELHRAIMKAGVKTFASHRNFMADLSSQFDHICQDAMRQKEQFPGQNSLRATTRMTLAKIDFVERDRLPPEELVKKHYDYWKAKGADKKGGN